jgi:hypothetical protein
VRYGGQGQRGIEPEAQRLQVIAAVLADGQCACRRERIELIRDDVEVTGVRLRAVVSAQSGRLGVVS